MEDENVIRNHPSTQGKWARSEFIDPLEELDRRTEPRIESPPSYEDEYGDVPLEQPVKPWAICSNCVFSYDIRPWWKRLFKQRQARDLYCSAISRSQAVHPVTGEITYTNSVFSTPSKGFPEPHERCQDMNLQGFCEVFATKEE